MLLENLFGLGTAYAETTAAAGQAAEAVNPTGTLISYGVMIVLMIVVFYFMLIRPQRKKDKQVKEMLDALKPGDRITTIGGIYGTIVNIKDDTITLAIGQRNQQPTEMVVARWAIRQVEQVTVENDGEVLT